MAQGMEKKKEGNMIEEKDMTPDSFRFFRTFYEAATMVGDDSTRLRFYDALNEYVFLGNQPSFFGDTSAEGRMLNMAWLLVKPVVDKSIGNSIGGRNSGGERPNMIGNTNAQKQHDFNSQSIVNQHQNNRDKDKDKDKEKDKEIEESTKKNRTEFVPPSIDEVREYVNSSGYAINAEAFVSHYEAVGWMVGKNKMKNWQAAVRSWASREKQQNPQPQPRKTKVVKNLDDEL